MNIIITAGGTREPIDSIRSITNKSSGALGKKIMDECLIAFPDASIYYLHGKYAHKFEHPPDNVKQIEIASTNSLINEIASLLSNEPIDLFIHSMAVADYTTNNVIDSDALKNLVLSQRDNLTEEILDNIFEEASICRTSKISSQTNIMIQLKKTVKVINQIKKISPHTFLVGFKLLNNVSEEELFDVGFDLLRKNRCNLVVANDLAKIDADNHQALLIYPEKTMDKLKTKDDIAKSLVDTIKSRINAAHPKSSRIDGNYDFGISYAATFFVVGNLLKGADLLPEVVNHNIPSKIGTYGNMSERIRGNEFLITGRNVDKADIYVSDLVLVKSVEFKQDKEGLRNNYATVNYQNTEDSSLLPSIDSAIHGKIYQTFDYNAILHVHTPDKLFLDVPVVYGRYPCGSALEMDAIVDCLKANPDIRIIQLEQHGLMVFGASLGECYNQVIKLLSSQPYIALNYSVTNQDDLDHLAKANAYFVMAEETHPLMINSNEIGLVWESFNDIQENTIDFGIYTRPYYQKKGLGILRKYLNMRKDYVLKLHTTASCEIADLYQIKHGFELASDDVNHLVLIKKLKKEN